MEKTCWAAVMGLLRVGHSSLHFHFFTPQLEKEMAVLSVSCLRNLRGWEAWVGCRLEVTEVGHG